tara:strand:- start:15110 stop:15718 length:609 start_codon:yes stop_codon:yes gene_type:complete
MDDSQSQEHIVSILKQIISCGTFPHFHFCGPNNDHILEIINSILSDFYHNKSMIMQIHVLDNLSESLLVQMITAFCNLQPVVANKDKNKPKIVIIHQQNEALTDNFIHFLEDRMSEKIVKFIFLTSSMHIVPTVLLNKMVSFTINSPNQTVHIDSADIFYNLLHSDIDDESILASKIIDWSTLHTLRIPSIIYDMWYENIIT